MHAVEHGTGVDHREIEAAVEAVLPDGGRGLRRIYPDLPGMGPTAADGLTCNDDVVAVLGDVVEHVAGGPALLLGHSYGAYLARGTVSTPTSSSAHRRPPAATAITSRPARPSPTRPRWRPALPRRRGQSPLTAANASATRAGSSPANAAHVRRGSPVISRRTTSPGGR